PHTSKLRSLIVFSGSSTITASSSGTTSTPWNVAHPDGFCAVLAASHAGEGSEATAGKRVVPGGSWRTLPRAITADVRWMPRMNSLAMLSGSSPPLMVASDGIATEASYETASAARRQLLGRATDDLVHGVSRARWCVMRASCALVGTSVSVA